MKRKEEKKEIKAKSDSQRKDMKTKPHRERENECEAQKPSTSFSEQGVCLRAVRRRHESNEVKRSRR